MGVNRALVPRQTAAILGARLSRKVERWMTLDPLLDLLCSSFPMKRVYILQRVSVVLYTRILYVSTFKFKLGEWNMSAMLTCSLDLGLF